MTEKGETAMDEDTFKLKKVRITKFRKLIKLTMNIGNNITVISGHNGVGKSSIMSLIASLSGNSKKRLNGEIFQPEFDDYFEIDPNTESLNISSDPDIIKPLYSSYKVNCDYQYNGYTFTKRTGFKNDIKEQRGIRIIPRTDKLPLDDRFLKEVKPEVVEKTNVGESARVPIPTIYLSLSRLMPARESNIETSVLKGNTNIIKNGLDAKYAEWYNEVLSESIDPDKSTSEIIDKKLTNKKRIFDSLKDASALTQSVGQDNLGSIISALIDFYNLKKFQTDYEYNGGMLCIDEIEASLHPSAQLKLIRLLEKLSEQLDLQVIITTHSLTILKEIISLQKDDSNKYQMIYFKGTDIPAISSFNDYNLLKADLFQEIEYVKPKVKIYVEDDTTRKLLALLIESIENIDPDYKKLPQYEVIPVFLGKDHLKSLIRYDSTYFSSILIILDGDAKLKNPKDFKLQDYLNDSEGFSRGLNPVRLSNNVLTLPDFVAPETYLYNIEKEYYENPIDHISFWRSVESNIDTTLNTSERIRAHLSFTPEISNLTIGDLKTKTKGIFKFAEQSRILVDYFNQNQDKKDEILTWYQRLYKLLLKIQTSNESSKY